MFHLLHAIIEKLPVHESEKAELHAQVDNAASVEDKPVETEETENGNG